MFGLEFGSTIAFAVVTETIFAWPGMGKLIIDSIYALDRPVMVAYLMVIVVLFVVDQPRGRPALLGARSARAPRSREASMTDAALDPVADVAAQTPFRARRRATSARAGWPSLRRSSWWC